VVGDGPLRNTLEAQTRALGLSDSVDFVGYQPNGHRWMSRAKVVVIARSGRGSLRAGRGDGRGAVPVGTAVGAIPEFLDDRRTG